MKKLYVCIVVFSILAVNTEAQVPSNIYSEKSKAFDFYPWFDGLRYSAPEIIMPAFDIHRLLEEDEAVKGKNVPYRFGKGFDVNYSLADGIWIKIDSGSVWLMKVTSPGAYSINFIFSKLFLPEGSELYIYSFEGDMVYGPVTSKQNLEEERLFLTDVIKGESVILYLYIPENKEEDAELVISRIVHGYKDSYAGLFESESLDGSGSCEKDVACYPNWNNESDAVALVLLGSGLEKCSGSLLNNTDQNFKAYFLTAFHCIDTDENGSLSTAEINNAKNWMFKFHYKKTSCGGGQIATAITYNHDNLRSAWYTSDFALVELVNSPLCNMCLTFLGWDKTGSTPTKGTTIHHPSGDVMKISFDYDQLVKLSNLWQVDWDIGATEPISSGAPLFDQNKRVVGQLAGGNSECGGSDMRDWFGRLDRSWSGGGADTSKLLTWLNPYGPPPNTLNTIRLYGVISGPWQVCASNSTFTLQNAPPGSTVTWGASSYVTPSSGTGTTATFHSTCTEAALSCVTFTISNPCISIGQTQASRIFMSAGPHPDSCKLYVTYSTGEPVPKPAGQYLLCPYKYYYFYAINTSDCSTSNYDWTLPPSLTKIWEYNNMVCVYTNNSNPGGNVIVKANTCCGCSNKVKILSDYVGKYPYCGSGYMSFTPDPADDETILELQTDNIENVYEGDKWDLEIYNQQSLLMHKATDLRENKYTINTSGWQEGIYFVRVIIKDKVLYGKFVVAR